MKTLKAVGCAMGACANDIDTALGPWYLYFHPEYFTMNWHHIHSFSSRERGLALEARALGCKYLRRAGRMS